MTPLDWDASRWSESSTWYSVQRDQPPEDKTDPEPTTENDINLHYHSHLHKHLLKTVPLPPTHHFLSQTVVCPMSMSLVVLEGTDKLLAIRVPLSSEAMPHSISYGFPLVSKEVRPPNGRQIEVRKARRNGFCSFVFNFTENHGRFSWKIAFIWLSLHPLRENELIGLVEPDFNFRAVGTTSQTHGIDLFWDGDLG